MRIKNGSKNLNAERGAVTVLFSILALILVGCISFSLYIGQQVEKKIRLQNANDLSVQALADHAAQGLNMMAVNNLSIGAAIHVAGSLPILASYLSALKILTATPGPALEDFVKQNIYVLSATQLDPGNVFQSDIWNNFAPIAGKFIQAASGLTRFNDYLNKYWMVPAPIYSFEMMRANLPDSLALPLQRSNLLNPLLMAYKDIKKTSPSDTICHAIKSSEAVKDAARRDDFTAWLEGPIKTLLDTSSAPGGLEQVWNKIKEATTKFLPVRIGFVKCGYGLKVPIFNFITGFIDRIVKNGLGVAAAVNLYQKLRGQTLNKIIDEVRGNAGTIPIPSTCGWLIPVPCIKRVPMPHCIAQWEAYSLQAKTAEGIFVANENYAKAHLLYIALNDIKKNKQNYFCEENLGDHSIKRVGYVPIPDEKGRERCLDLNAVQPLCAYKDIIDSLPASSSINCGEISNRFNEWRDNDCRGFNELATSIDVDASPEFGISAADWGRQAHYYANGGGLWAAGDKKEAVEKRQTTLGFLIPTGASSHFKEFFNSLKFVNIAANSIRTAQDLSSKDCPKEFLSTDRNGTGKCDFRPLVGLSVLSDGDAEQKRNQIEQNLSSGGLQELIQNQLNTTSEHVGDLKGDWSKVQWSVAQADVKFIPSHDDPRSDNPKAWLFWPAWQANLVHVENGMFSKVLDILLPTRDMALNQQISALR